MSKFNTKKIESKLKKILSGFEKNDVSVGWFENAKYENGMQAAQVAAWNEFGTMKTPARPFIRPAIEKNKEDWSKSVQVLLASSKSPEQTLEGVGLIMSADIAQQIEDTNSPPLSPVTLMMRKFRREGREMNGATYYEAINAVRRGDDYGGAPTDPLTDTGYMISSITSLLTQKT